MPSHAVLTGDIVNSTRLVKGAEKKLLKLLKEVLAPYKFEFYRGDSFQVYLKDAGVALETALLCRTAAISIANEYADIASDIRASIGIGNVKMPVTTLGQAKGDAFVLSGRAFDELSKTNTRLAIESSNTIAGAGLEILADYTNAIFKNMTGKQAVVIFELLKGVSQEAVAIKLKKSRSTISQHVNAGRWPEIEKLLKHYKKIINLLT